MHEDRTALASTWLQTGRCDFHVAELLLHEMPAASCFNAQQAAEKALKAVVVFCIGDAPRLPALKSLFQELAAIGEPIPDEVVACGKYLDQFYMPTRYPDALGDIDPHSVYSAKQSNEALAAAKVIIDWAAARIVHKHSDL